MISRHGLAISLFVISTILLSACGPTTQPVAEIVPSDTLVVVPTETVPLPTATMTPEELPTAEPTATATEAPKIEVDYKNIADVPLENRLFTRGAEYTVNESNQPLGTGMVNFPDSRVKDFFEERSKEVFGDSGLKYGWLSGIVMGEVIIDNESGNMTIPLGVENSSGELVTIKIICHVGNESEVYTGEAFDLVPKRGLGAYPGYDLQSANQKSQVFDIVDLPNNFVPGKQIILVVPDYASLEQANNGLDHFINNIPDDIPLNACVRFALEYAKVNIREAFEVQNSIKNGTVSGEPELKTFVYFYKVPVLQ